MFGRSRHVGTCPCLLLTVARCAGLCGPGRSRYLYALFRYNPLLVLLGSFMSSFSVTLLLLMASIAHLSMPNSIDMSLSNILTAFTSDSSSAIDFYTVSDHPYEEDGLS